MKALPAELEKFIIEAHSWMFTGDQQEVAKLCGKSESTVSSMFNFKMTPSKEFLDAAKVVMDKNKRRWDIESESEMKVA
jgi:hypothetical protein